MNKYPYTTAIKDSEHHWRSTKFIMGESPKYGKYIKIEKPISKEVVECYYYDAQEFISCLNHFIKVHKQSPEYFEDDDMVEFVRANYDDILDEISEKVVLLYKRNHKSNEVRNRELTEKRSSSSSSRVSYGDPNCHWGLGWTQNSGSGRCH